MSGIELGMNAYRIVAVSPERARLEIHSLLEDIIYVHPRHSFLSLIYNEKNGEIEIKFINGTDLMIMIPVKPSGERDTRSMPKLKRLFTELSDMIS